MEWWGLYLEGMDEAVVHDGDGELLSLCGRGCCWPYDVAPRKIVCTPSAVACEAGAVLCDVECFGLEPVYVVEVDVFSAGTSFVCPCGSVCLLRGCGCSPDALDSSVV